MRFVTAAMTIYAWALAAVVIAFLYFIGRFFQEKAGQKTFYRGYGIPICLFALGALRYAIWGRDLVGDFWGDSLTFAGGVLLILLGNHLRRLMVGDKR